MFIKKEIFIISHVVFQKIWKIVNTNVGITTDETRANEHFCLPKEEAQGKPKIVKFGSEEAWEAFTKQTTQPMIMDKYIGSWRQLDNLK